MSAGQCKSAIAKAVGQCEKCGTRHAHAGDGCICYLCGGWLRAVAAGNGAQKEAAAILAPRRAAQPASIQLINELYARSEAE